MRNKKFFYPIVIIIILLGLLSLGLGLVKVSNLKNDYKKLRIESEEKESELLKEVKELKDKATSNNSSILELEKENDDLREKLEKLKKKKSEKEKEIKDLEGKLEKIRNQARVKIGQPSVVKSNTTSRGMVGGRSISRVRMKSYMDYRAITDKSSRQYKLQQKAYTDSNGLRKIGDYYCVALGSYYSTNIGDRFIITMDDGESFKAILADVKSDKHTDSSNRVHSVDGSIVEFVVDERILPSNVKRMGSISYLGGIFKNEIAKITRE